MNRQCNTAESGRDKLADQSVIVNSHHCHIIGNIFFQCKSSFKHFSAEDMLQLFGAEEMEEICCEQAAA